MGARITVADTCISRLRGLLGKTELESEGGLLIRPSCGVHTFGMKFAIDAVALDRSQRVLEVWPDLQPNRIAGINWRARCVLELPAGKARAADIEPGDLLEITAHNLNSNL